MNPITSILKHYPLLLLDGALATELESKGCNLADPLWSARVLLDRPELIAAVHLDYFMAGADCVITASYQATVQGLTAKGLTEAEALQVISSSVSIAKRVRDNFWQDNSNRHNRPKPLVAASVGPYGAYLADGSEYRGNYGLTKEELADFHRSRLDVLVAAQPDILACETIPCLEEALALADLLTEYPDQYCWISFTAKDDNQTCNDDAIMECGKRLNNFKQVAAIGINCTAPQYVASLISKLKSVTDKPIIVYPNSGDQYDPLSRKWIKNNAHSCFCDFAKSWYEQGARVIGGCCRTAPSDIKAIAGWARKMERPFSPL
jgi:homocysteine S-methyltransferase